MSSMKERKNTYNRLEAMRQYAIERVKGRIAQRIHEDKLDILEALKKEPGDLAKPLIHEALVKNKPKWDALIREIYVDTAAQFARYQSNQLTPQKAATTDEEFLYEIGGYTGVYLDGVVNLKADMINANTEAIIIHQIDDDLEMGMSEYEIQDDISTLLDQMGTVRSNIIADNETHQAANFGLFAGALIAGMAAMGAAVVGAIAINNMSKEWVTQHDDKVRDAHNAMDGITIPVWQPFTVYYQYGKQPGDDELMMFPGDNSMGASPGNTINCRCYVIYHFGASKEFKVEEIKAPWLTLLLKHLPGEHDQESHGNRYDASGNITKLGRSQQEQHISGRPDDPNKDKQYVGEFKSKDEVKSWFTSAHPEIKLGKGLDKMDLKNLNAVARVIDRLNKDYPVLAGKLHYVGDGSDMVGNPIDEFYWLKTNYLACIFNDHDLCLNPMDFADGKHDWFVQAQTDAALPGHDKIGHVGDDGKYVEENVPNGQPAWHPDGTGSVEAVVAHEMGHVLEAAILDDLSKRAFLPLIDNGMATGRVTSTLNEFQDKWFQYISQNPSKSPSGYALTNANEMFAEGFSTLYGSQTANDNEYVQHLGKLLDLIKSSEPLSDTNGRWAYDYDPNDPQRAVDMERMWTMRDYLGLNHNWQYGIPDWDTPPAKTPLSEPNNTPRMPKKPRKELDLLDTILTKGGAGSGNYGHEGRPGEVGGSAPGMDGHITHVDQTQMGDRERRNSVPQPKTTNPRELPLYKKMQEDGAGAIVDLIEAKDRPVGDMILREILKEQGFDAKPDICTKEEMDHHVRMGEKELFRGLRQSQYADDFRDGELYAGSGVFGNGTYTAYSNQYEEGAAIAHGYANQNHDDEYADNPGATVLRMCLKNDARVIDYNELGARAKAETEAVNKEIAGLKTHADSVSTLKQIDALESYRGAVLGDPGRYAASLGYDAIDIPLHSYMLVINRGAVRVQQTNHVMGQKGLKHLPGEHDQATHGNRYGANGQSHVGRTSMDQVIRGGPGNGDTPEVQAARDAQLAPPKKEEAQKEFERSSTDKIIGKQMDYKSMPWNVAYVNAAMTAKDRDEYNQMLEKYYHDPNTGDVNGDGVLYSMAAAQGYDGAPNVVTQEEMDQLIKDGSIELFRGVQKPEFSDQFRTGTYWAGSGAWGSGTYTAYDKAPDTPNPGVHIARMYGDNVMRMTIKPDAKIIDYRDLHAAASDDFQKLDDRLREISEVGDVAWNDNTGMRPKAGNEEEFYSTRAQIEVLMDLGRCATYYGYDAVRIPEEGFMVVTNRTALIVQDHDLADPYYKEYTIFLHLKQAFDALEEKHLPGEHDQAAHGNRYGATGNATHLGRAATNQIIRKPESERRPIDDQLTDHRQRMQQLGEPKMSEYTPEANRDDIPKAKIANWKDFTYIKDYVKSETEMKPQEAYEFMQKYDVSMQLEEMVFKSLTKDQGFDAKPDTCTPEELDQHIKDGEKELFRGVCRVEYADQFRDGDLFVGTGGLYGDGTYTAYDHGMMFADNSGGAMLRGTDVAKGYATSAGAVLRMTLKADAKVADYAALTKEMQDEHKSALKEMDDLPEDAPNVEQRMSELSAYTKLLCDPGRYAMVKGYDAIDIKSEGYMLVMNRGALRVQTENYDVTQKSLEIFMHIKSLITAIEEKHLPGEHDQATHGNRYGSNGNATHLGRATTTQIIQRPKTPREQLEGQVTSDRRDAQLRRSEGQRMDPLVPEPGPTKGTEGGMAFEDTTFYKDFMANAGLPEMEFEKVMAKYHDDLVDPADHFALSIFHDRNMDAKPEVVTSEQLDKFIKDGELEMYRGLMRDRFAAQFIDGEMFVGQGGVHGDGIYTGYTGTIKNWKGETAERSGYETAKDYGSTDGGVVLRMTLKADAKVIDEAALKEMMRADHDANDEVYNRINNKPMAERTAEETAQFNYARAYNYVLGDQAVYAAMKGYDAIDVKTSAYMVIMNRGALRVQNEKEDPMKHAKLTTL